MKGRQELAENKPRFQDRINNHHREEKKIGFITERVKQTLPSLPTLLAAQVEELSTWQVLTVGILDNAAAKEREKGEGEDRSREGDTRRVWETQPGAQGTTGQFGAGAEG